MISIIIPVYNQANKLGKCLTALAKQTFSDFEIIIVNDGSTDYPEVIINDWQKNHPEFKLRYTKQSNHGAPAARNRGASQAPGEYLLFLDADIKLRPDALAKLHSALVANPAAAFAYSSFKFGHKIFKLWPFSLARLRQRPYIHTASLIRSKFFPGWDESLKRFQDWDLFLTMAEQGGEGIFIPEILMTVETGGTMSQWRPKLFYKIFPNNKSVLDYNRAAQIIHQKHHLNN